MKIIQQYIQEKLKLNKDIKVNEYTCHPKDRFELRKILEERLKEDKNAYLNDIDVSKITDMSALRLGQSLFYHLDPHNIDISSWNVGNVTNMSFMFYGCENFNCDISEWDVRKVTNMNAMFYGCENFYCNLNNWDVSNVDNMNGIFEYCPLENNPPKWYKK